MTDEIKTNSEISSDDSTGAVGLNGKESITKNKTDEFTPRQRDFIRFYFSPKEKTFGNALQSALKAGYTREYAESILCKDLVWLADFVGKKKRLLTKAENALEETLDMPVEVQRIEGYGEDKEVIVRTEPALVKIKQDTAKFIAETVGKEEGYSKRTELTGKDGKAIEINQISYERAKDIIRRGEGSDKSDSTE